MEQARARIRESGKIAALTGAGISAESGVPTFRGDEGLWKKYRSEELATPQAFNRNPELVWEWYNWRRGLIAGKKPNPGHHALASLEKNKDFTLITQNVDGLHALAGSRNILELHGSLWRVRCTKCNTRSENRTVPLVYPPKCEKCQGLLRPDVVWFGESLDQDLLYRAFTLAAEVRVMMVIGTSAMVQPAASLAWQAQKAGAFVIEINVGSTAFSREADLVLNGPSGQILPAIIE